MSLAALLERAGQSSARLLLAGAPLDRLEAAAARLRQAGLRSVAVVGQGLQPEGHPRLGEVAALLRARAPERVRDAIHALDLAVEPVRFALGLASLGEADAVVAGPSLAMAAFVETAVWIFGPHPEGYHSASWLLLPTGRLVAYADCALPTPAGAAEQAALGRAVGGVHALVAGEEPRVVTLPASSEPRREALRFRGGENVFIFPGGAAGALALDLAQDLAGEGALRIGPLLLGPPGLHAGAPDAGEDDELVGTAAATVLAAGRT